MNQLTESIDISCSPELESLLDEFIDSWRAGKAPAVAEFAELHPVYQQEIIELLPALLLAEQLNFGAFNHGSSPSNGVPEQLGVFTLHREIGRGGMGIVYEATQQPFSQKFAVKVLKNRTVASNLLRTRFIREAEAASTLHHPNIVPSKYYGTDNSYNYLVMPMIDGISLDRLIAKKNTNDPDIQKLFEAISVTWKKLARLGAQVASALHHAHENGLIHRDIKPANLILDRQGDAWVTDFGLAKLFEEGSTISKTGDLIGTPRYMSPEQVFGVPDARSDIYSLGLTLYEILTADFPDTRMRRCLTHAKASVLELPDLRYINPSVPVPLVKVVMKACSHHPESRYQTAREFEIALNELTYEGIEDRRNNVRGNSKSTNSPLSNNLILFALVVIIIWCLSTLSKPEMKVVDHPGVVNQAQVFKSIPPPTYCIVYDEPGSNLVNVEVSVCSRTDDVEEYDDGIMFIDSSDLELTWDETDQLVGLRFAGVEIPSNAVIQSAKICFYASKTEQAPTNLRIFGIEDANPVTFSPLQYNLSKRQRTHEWVEWLPDPTTRYELFETPSCVEIVQHLVELPDWKSGNAMAFYIDGKGIRSAIAYDSNIHYSPILKVQYQRTVED